MTREEGKEDSDELVKTVSRNLNLLSFRDSCAMLPGQYDSALVK